MERLLKFAEKKLQLNIRTHLKNGSYLMVGAVSGLISNLAISVAFANLLSPSIYGSYKYIQSLVTVIGSFSLTQTATVVTRSVAKGYEGSWKKGAIEMLLWSVVPFIIGIVLSSYYLFQENYVLAASLAVGSLLAPLGLVARLYAAYLNGKQKFKETAKTQLVRSAVPTLALVAAAFYFDSTLPLVTTFFLSYLITDAALSLYVYLNERPGGRGYESDSSLTKHLSFMNLLSTGANHLDKILVFQFFGASELALYAIATALPQQANLVTGSIKTLLYPKISSRSLEELKKQLPFRAVQVGAVFLLILATYVVAAPYLFKFLFPVYIDGIAISQVYAIGTIFVFGMPFLLALKAHSRTKELYTMTIVSSVLKIILTLIFVTSMGVWGAVISFIVSRLISNLLMILSFYLIK